MRLGEIHQWLYNKIIILEEIENEIARWAVSQGLKRRGVTESLFSSATFRMVVTRIFNDYSYIQKVDRVTS